MNIEEYADALNLTLRINRYPNQCNRYVAGFEDAETKDSPDSGFLASTYGNGSSAQRAVEDYVNKIHGKILVVFAMNNEKRREYVVPMGLEA